MTEIRLDIGAGPISAGRSDPWVRPYASGRYTEVVRAWLAARTGGAGRSLVAPPEVAEAVGWSVALTKSWDAYPALREDLSAHPAHASLVAILDAWRAIHEGRYDAATHAARSARGVLLAPGSPARVLAQALKVEAVALFRMGRYAESEALTRSALEIFRMAGDRLDESHCANNLGLVQNARGDLVAAQASLQCAVDALLDLGAADERLALARVNLAVVELHLGHVDVAREHFASSLAVFESFGLRSEQITAQNGLGHCARARGEHDAALAHHRAALRLAGADLPRQVGLCHEFLGRVYLERGDRRRAERHYRRALEIAAHIAPDGDLMLEVSWHYAELLAATGRGEAARPHVERAEALCAATRERRELGCVQRARARVMNALGDPGARTMFETAFETLLTGHRPFDAALTLVTHAEAEVDWGSPERAATLYARARVLLQDRLPGSRWIGRVEHALERLREAGATGAAPRVRHGFVTRDPELVAVLEDLPRIGASPYPVLVEGESGTGKEVVARAVHAASGRSGSWVALNCAALPRDLFESELFGHVRGAFSGASIEKPGLIEQAAGGTLFLDEVGELPIEMQAKLLRVLDDGMVRRVGDVRQRHVDVKIVAATNVPLEVAVAAGRFRTDLYHRLAVHSLRIPPLRERPCDIEPLARHFVARERLETLVELGPELLTDLESRPWQGNARELRNFLIRVATQSAVSAGIGHAERAPSLRDTRSSHERRAIEAALAASGGSVGAAALALRLHVTTLRRKMRALGIER